MSSKSKSGSRKHRLKYASVCSADDSSAAALFALMNHLFAIVRGNYEGAMADPYSMHLHDARVALRRMRSVLRFFKPLKLLRNRREIDGLLRTACRVMGRMRDLQARLEVVEKLLGKDAPGYEDYKKDGRKHIADEMTDLRSFMSGGEWVELMTLLGEIVDTPQQESSEEGVLFESFAARRMRKTFRRLPAALFGSVRNRSSGELHSLRKKMRRLRYKVEIAAPVLGVEMAKLETLMKDIADDLGFIHDIDMSFEAGEKGKLDLDKSLAKRLIADRKKRLTDLDEKLAQAEELMVSPDMNSHLKSLENKSKWK